MKRAIALWGLLFVSLCSCEGEDPLITEIQKVVEVDMEFSANRTDSNGTAALTETTDIVGEDFTEYLNQIRDFEVNAFSIELQAVDTTPGAGGARFERLALEINSVETGGASVEMFDLSGINIGSNALKLTLFTSDSNNSSQLNNAVNFVRSRLLREQPIAWELEAQVDGLSNTGHINIKLLLDLTAEVILQ